MMSALKVSPHHKNDPTLRRPPPSATAGKLYAAADHTHYLSLPFLVGGTKYYCKMGENRSKHASISPDLHRLIHQSFIPYDILSHNLFRNPAIAAQENSSPAVAPTPSQRTNHPGNSKAHVMSQAIAGLIVAPIERVNILMQCQNEMLKSGTLSSPYKGMKDCLFRTIKHEGVFSLWRGSSLRVFETVAVPTILMIIVKKQQAEQKKMEDITWIQSLSLIMIHALYKQPLEYARTRLACDVKAARKLHNYSLDSSPRSISNGVGNWRFSGVFDVYYKTLKLDGVHGLYRGCTCACVGMFVSYETSKQIRSRNSTSKENKERRGLIGLSFKAMLAFLVTSAVHYPFITVNRRMMMTSGETTKYKGALGAIHQILKHEGVSTLYKGVIPFFIYRLAFSCTTVAVLISADYGLKLMK